MAIPPQPMGSLTDSGIEAPEGMSVEVPQPQDFAGGAEVMQQPDGSAMIQALMGGLEDGDGMAVEAEPYNHDANLVRFPAICVPLMKMTRNQEKSGKKHTQKV